MSASVLKEYAETKGLRFEVGALQNYHVYMIETPLFNDMEWWESILHMFRKGKG